MKINSEDFYNLNIIPGYQILLLMTFSLGLYVIPWLYFRSKELDFFFKEKFNSKAFIFCFLIIPLFWIGINNTLKHIFLSKTSYYVCLTIYLSFQILFILKFFFDFCFKFGKLTRTDGSLWFFLLILGMIGYTGIIFHNLYILPIILIFILTITAIQLELNKIYRKYTVKKIKNILYDV